jgi:hypothetical protein
LYAVRAREISEFFVGWELSAAFIDAEAQLFIKPVHLDAKGVDRTAELFGQRSAVIDVPPVSFAVIEYKHLTLLRF